jgi:hypothetical protein
MGKLNTKIDLRSVSESLNLEKVSNNDLSLRVVYLVPVSVQKLFLDLDISFSEFSTFKHFFQKQNSIARNLKTILNDINAYMLCKSLTTIIDNSESDKTFMLNTLINNMSEKRLKISSVILYNENSRLTIIRSV